MEDNILSELHKISEKLNKIEERLDSLENKTKDIHQFVPFVGWLNSIGNKVCALKTFQWAGITDIPEKPIINEED